MNDWHLLQAWATRRSESAFAELTRRHLNLVYASALRQVSEPELARDVAQAVFLALARKAARIGPKVILSGWLFRTTRFVAARAVRAEQRRQRHEHEAAAMNPLFNDPPAIPEHWREVEPHLDAALADLPAADRDAVLLRYFEQQPLRSVAERLGVSEDAAKKRVSRAVEKLRGVLGKHGVPLTGVALTALLTQLPSSAAPVEAVTAIATAATAEAVSPTVAALATQALSDWFWSRVRSAMPWAGATLVLIVGGVAWMAHQPTAPTAPTLAANTPPTETEETATSAPLAPTQPAPAVPGPATILLNVRSAEDNQPLRAQVRVNIWRFRGDTSPLDLATGDDGTVEIPVKETGIGGVNVWLSAPGYVPMLVEWKGHEFVEPLLLHTTRLQRGRTLQGVVQDESGNPVAGAQIQFNGPGIDLGERENIAFHPQLTSLTTDAAGRFRSDQMPLLVGLLGLGYTVEHPDFVRERAWLRNPETLATNHVVVLKRGLRVSGRVVDSAEQPIAGATVLEDHNFGGPHRQATTDYDGNFAIGPFAPGTVPLEASANGFQKSTQQVPVTPSATNIVLKLAADINQPDDWQLGWNASQTMRLTGTVVDDESGLMLPLFRVRLNEHPGTALHFLGEGHDGRFDWPVFMAYYLPFSLQVEADGYEPSETDTRPIQAGDQSFAVRLRRAWNLAGVVVTPEGQPVAGAFVGLNGDRFGHILNDDGRAFSGNDAPQTITDAAGRFSFKPRLGAESVLVVHDLGCTLAPLASFTNRPIVLQPWGAIEGTLLVGGQPAPGQKVALEMDVPLDAGPALAVNVQGTATTDAEGRFRFPRLPAGPIRVGRYFNFNRDGTGSVGFSHQERVVVPAGDVVQVTIGGKGRTLVGHLALSRPLARHDWRDDLQSLVEDTGRPEPRFRGTPDSPGWREIAREFARYRASQRRYYLEIQPDGAFHIADVAPGEYTLLLVVSEPPDPNKWDPSGNPVDRPPLGKLSPRVTVPDGPVGEPIDLGTFTIPLKDSAAR